MDEVHPNVHRKKGLAGVVLPAKKCDAVQGQDTLDQVLGDFELPRNETLEL